MGTFIKFFWWANLRISSDTNCFIETCQPVTWMAIIMWNLTARTHNVSIQADHWTTNHFECLQCTVYEQIWRLNNIWNCLLSSRYGWQGPITLSFLNCFSYGQSPVSWSLVAMSHPFSIMLLDTQSPPWCCWTCCPLFPGTSAKLFPYCCSCWAWVLSSWQWFGWWQLFAVLALLNFLAAF